MNAEFGFLAPKYIENDIIVILKAIFKRVKISIFYRNCESKLVVGCFLIYIKNCLMDFFVLKMDGVNNVRGYWTVLMTSPYLTGSGKSRNTRVLFRVRLYTPV